MRMDADHLLELVDLVHAGGSCDAARARSAAALSDAFGGAAVMLFRQAGAVVEDLEHARWPEASVALCTGRYCDPKMNRTLRSLPHVPLGVPARADAVGEWVWESSEVFVHAMLPFGLVHPLGALLARTARDVSVVSLLGRASAGPFSSEADRLLERLLPALMSADRVRRLLVQAMEARAMLEDALDRIGRPVAVVDEDMRLRYANTPAEGMLEEGAGLRLRAGRLAATGPGGDERLRAKVRDAVAPGGGGGVVPLDDRGGGVVRVEPLRPGETGVSRPLALVLGAARAPVAVDDLRTVYGLTPREAEVAALFAAGAGVGEAAARLGRSANTIKTEARAIYGKLGVGGHAAAAARIRNDFAC